MYFGNLEDIKWLEKCYNDKSFEQRLYEIAKDDIWNSIKFAIMTHKNNVTVFLSREYADRIELFLKGQGLTLERKGLKLRISW